MIRALSLGVALTLASGMMWADTIVLGSNTLVNMPASISNPGPGTGCGGASGSALGSASSQCGYLGTGPYWDNDSGTGKQLNIGYFLTGTGGYAGDTNYAPAQYLSGGAGGAPTSISLDYSGGSSSVSLLTDNTGDTTLTFGYYNANGGAETPIYGPLIPNDPSAYAPVSLSLTPGEDYGFYLTRSCFSACPAGDTSGYVTLFSNPTLNTCTTAESAGTCSTDQHFAIFTSSTPGVYYVSIEDWGLLGTPNNGEGNGDFNDIVFELNTDSPAQAPEPASFALIGVGLLGLGLARFRNRAV